MEDLIVIIILAFIVGFIVLYLVRERKRGNKCVGCPYAKKCSKKNNKSKCAK